MELFYEPKNAVVGDVIPFYDKGCFKPFYLRGTEATLEMIAPLAGLCSPPKTICTLPRPPREFEGGQALCCWWMKCIIFFTALLSKIQNGKR